MRYGVTTAFKDKYTQKNYLVGSSFESEDQDRISYLQSNGFLSGEPIPETESENDDSTSETGAEDNPEIKHVGGGYYELPNGEKVKGKEKALETLKTLNENSELEKE